VKQRKSKKIQHAPWLTTFWGGRRGVLQLWDGTKKNENHLIIHMNLHNIKQQVGYCISEALLVLGRATGKFKLTRLNMARAL
jgi:hypothetical protein